MKLLISGLLDRELTLLRTSDQFPAPAHGWLLQLSPDAARLVAPEGTVAYEGRLDPPRPWLDPVRRAMRAVS